MSQTPTNARNLNLTWGRSTPSGSPYTRSASRQYNRPGRSELSLGLKQVIGTTISRGSGFDSLPSAQCFAYTAGAAAVVATVNEDNDISQRFYRARPTTTPQNPITLAYGPTTPTPSSDTRSRTAASLQAAGIGTSSTLLPSPEWADSPGKSWSAKERVKAATCVSLSRDGKYLAVGETGYKPRVLIFSTSKDALSDVPLTCISDHTYGVSCVAFSPDSQYLATLGCSNDGFLFIWKINQKTGAATLLASNKCTSNINQIAWVRKGLITVGTRHVKVWRVDESEPSPTKSKFNASRDVLAADTPSTLPGRNCLLGSLLDSTFTTVVEIDSDKAVVCSDRGDVCILDDSDGDQRFYKVDHVGFPVTAVVVDSKKRLLIAGTQGRLSSLEIETLHSARACPPSPSPSVVSSVETSRSAHHKGDNLVAMASLNNQLVAVDSRRSIKLYDQKYTDSEALLGSEVQQLPAHGDAVLGVRAMREPFDSGASFYTWSAEGTVLFWHHDGHCKKRMDIEIEQVENISEVLPNELRVVRVSSKNEFVVSGDRYGVLRVMDMTSGTPIFYAKAHSQEITDIALHEGTATYVACCSRDRVVQVFYQSADTFELLQTLDEHVGAVHNLLFTNVGDRLISCSADRTVVVRELVSQEIDGLERSAFIILRTITLKASPAAMTIDIDKDDFLWVSTVDRQILKYGLRTGHQIFSFKPSDSEGGDAVVISSLVQIPSGKGAAVLAGICTTDKSIRLYDDAGSIIGREWGHTEGVSDIALVTSHPATSPTGHKFLVTVAVDGTIFIWTIAAHQKQHHDASKSLDLLSLFPNSNNSLLAKPPLRRVLSQSELARFQRSPESDTFSTPVATPRSPKVRKRTSRLAILQTPKLEPKGFQQQTDSSNRRSTRHRSPSPSSPRNPQLAKARRSSLEKTRRPSLDMRSRTKSSPSLNVAKFGTLAPATDDICKNLRAYRKRLANSRETLTSENVRELEKELGLTVRAVTEKAKGKVIDEERMVKLLDDYTDKLVNLLVPRFREVVTIQSPPQSPRTTEEREDSTGCGADRDMDASYSNNKENQEGAKEKSALMQQQVMADVA